MADIRPFLCIRPREDEAAEIAALPYDVYNREEAKKAVEGHDKSFLRIDRAETQFDDSVDTYAPEVYKKAHDMLWDMVAEGDFVKEEKPCYYIYELTMDGRVQTGITACASIDDYQNQVIKKHENTRADKEQDRINHVNICDAQTGPIFLAYRSNDVINAVVEKVKKTAPLYDFVAEDGIGHRVYRIAEAEDIAAIEEAFAKIKEIYIADGHHRAASAVKVGLMRRAEHPDYDGTEKFNYFLSVLFPDDQLMIMDYNRVVKDLNGMTEEEFLGKMNDLFEVGAPQKEAVHPAEKGSFSMYLGDNWYACRMKEADLSSDPVDGLDVSILQNVLLHPVLGIEDPKTDKRIDFVGGIRGLEELERRVHSDCKVAFAMYPTSIGELFAVADAGRLMPPKSTWFEPKLRSGLFIHALS
ncbi:MULTISPECIES: DUF1015 domain-containing protein [unclassified Roseburia]|uniref:DUF1015 domain-containing protein n=1 Tax=unclassified Roseburia TaxID=2637578 RepID=UPI000E4E54E8|nr:MULTISPECIES: DUF1015 family protein [unclassified Roseburia]RHQ41469.1 DUF1015 domain-containing protein [Roseburia sp. AF25-25LB]RHQ44354.1 DUF1015 domain-containing protein [Roseburia sp. AF25-18LB]RHQ51526.1 DUF1015 domain-containing protein [Roseburia sp. AF25-15LB]RHQ52582.1 DUF1015 domain-containing protein [Roseburia sp. AF25-13LB]